MLEVKPRPVRVPVPARSGPQAGLSIAEAARRSMVSVHTLRYYERADLVVTTQRVSAEQSLPRTAATVIAPLRRGR
jgi:hypothetical protein